MPARSIPLFPLQCCSQPAPLTHPRTAAVSAKNPTRLYESTRGLHSRPINPRYRRFPEHPHATLLRLGDQQLVQEGTANANSLPIRKIAYHSRAFLHKLNPAKTISNSLAQFDSQIA